MELLWEMIGWAGAVAMLGSYLSVSMGWLKPGVGFQTFNLLGSCAFIINGTLHGAWPSVATNVAWFLISAVALIRLRAAQAPTRAEARAETRPETRVFAQEPRSPHSTDTGTHLVIPLPQAVANCP